MSEYKIIVMGAGGVGKSALTIRFMQDKFVEKYDPTIEDSYRKQVDVDGAAVMLDILDTAGQEEYGAMRETYMASGQGFVLVYSIIDQHSFDEVAALYEQLAAAKGSRDVPVVLIGNKCDLEGDRVVEKTDAEALVRDKMQGAVLLEASAKTNTNVEAAFVELVRLINKKQGTVVVAEGTSQEQAAQQEQPKQDDKKKKKKKGCLIL